MRLITNSGNDRVIDALRSIPIAKATLNIASSAISLDAFGTLYPLLRRLEQLTTLALPWLFLDQVQALGF